MKTTLPIALLLVLTPSASLQTANRCAFLPLFLGNSFYGWEGNRKIFRLQDEAIVGGSLKQRIPNNEFLCTTRQFGDFELRLKAKLIGEGHNAGIQFRSQRIPNHHEVKGYQCDIGRMRGRSIWGSLYDESRRRKFLAEGENEKLQKVVKVGGWNELLIRCQGRRIQIWVNGLQTVDYVEQDKSIPQRGIIGLQIHGGAPAEAWYKNIEIKQL